MSKSEKTPEALCDELNALRQRVQSLEKSMQALSEREQQYRAIYTSMAEGVALHEVIYDTSGNPVDYRIVEVNPAYTAITGLTRERAVGSLAAQLYGTETPPYLKEFTSVLKRDAFSFETYFPPLKKHFSISVFSPGANQFATVFTDITERKRTEEALKASEEKYRLVVENAHESILVAQDGMLRYVNPKVSEFTGYSEHHLTTQPFIDIVHPDDRALVAERHRKRLAGEDAPFQYTFRIMNRNQDVQYVELNSIFITWENKPAALCFMVDITQRRQMEQERIRTQRLRAVGELSAGVSHNLNNILTGIMGPAQLLQMQSKDPRVLKEADIIYNAAIRARDLVHQLHVSTHQFKEEPLHAVQVNDGIQEALTVCQPRLKDESEARGIAIEVQTTLTKIPLIWGTASGLHDIVVNLLLNAADAMPDGGIITLATQQKNGGVEIVISDTGTGMDERTRQQIFEPFFTTKMDVGSGLGLYTVYGAVTQWGGQIAVESELGKGTTVTLWLPSSKQTDGSELQTNLPPTAHSARLTIVEDDPTVREFLREVLTDHYDVVVFEDGKQALENFVPQRFNIAFIDQGLPGIPGDQVAREMRKQDPALVTILITGWEIESDDPRLLAYDFHLQKPFEDIHQVMNVISQGITLHNDRVQLTNQMDQSDREAL